MAQPRQGSTTEEAIQSLQQTMLNVSNGLQQINNRMGKMELDYASSLVSIRQQEDAIANLQTETKNSRRKHPQKSKKKKKVDTSDSEEEETDDGSNSSQSDSSQQGESEDDHRSRSKTKNNWRNNDLAGFKLKVPEFAGKSDPEVYLEWEEKVDRLFDLQDYSEKKKVKLAVLEFSGSASIWWRSTCRARSESMKEPISTWKSLKRNMRKKYVPPHHKREVLKKLQGLTQGSKSVDEYHDEMELRMMRANVEEDEEAIMARFLNGLNRNIANVVELQQYHDMNELLQKALMVEKQLKSHPQGARSTQPLPPWQ